MTSYQCSARGLVAALTFFAAAPPAAPAQTQEIRVELYTMGPGDQLFSKFGHAALCVSDAEWREGRCFNYGTADFSTPGPLTWAVLRGRAEFWVSVAFRDDMLRLYRGENRTIYRQMLPLSVDAAAELKQALATNALPENRSYQYDHFRDNCSTRPRDHIDQATGGALVKKATHDYSTFRELIRQDLEDEPLYFLAVQMFLGRPMDQARSEYEAMFLPRVLRDAVQRHLQVTPDILYARSSVSPRFSPGVWHFLTLALGVGIASGLVILRAPARVSSWLQRLFACLAGTLGSAVWALAILSPLPEVRYNEVLLVFLPADFVLLLGSARSPTYAGMRTAVLALVCLLCMSGILIQPLGTFLALILPPLFAIWARERKKSNLPSLRTLT